LIDREGPRRAVRSLRAVKARSKTSMRMRSMDDERVAMVESRRRAEGLRAALEERGDGPVRLVETHISWVLLTRALAFKLKKPVRLPFLDFRTLAARAHYSREEFRLNRRLAPALYLDVVDVCEGPSGLRLGGDGRVVDVALRMTRFRDGALWSERLAAGQLSAADVDALAQRLADFHRRLPWRPSPIGTAHRQCSSA
jgi:aminoglycoside phosphotransferase family enzyme